MRLKAPPAVTLENTIFSLLLLFVAYAVAFQSPWTAAKAYEIGAYHFDARNPTAYDIAFAERLFNRALEHDPKYPFAHHQLARIEFLKGDFASALWHINREIEFSASPSPSSYYVRGLIEGFAGDYESAIKDYKYVIENTPPNWAGINDYAWVLLKAGHYEEARAITDEGLKLFVNNPWLLNSNAIARYELGDYEGALSQLQIAQPLVETISKEMWLKAYPGNDPQVASMGLKTFKDSVEENIHRIEIALASTTVQ